MSTPICSCENPSFPSLGRPKCAIEMKAIAFPIIIPRYNAGGQRNTIDLTSSSLGLLVKEMISTDTTASDRMYPFPKCENASFERSETLFETAPSGRKVRIDGVGGIRTMKFELWSKDASFEILRQLSKIGCTEIDMFLVDVAGQLWGIKDDVNSNELRGYAVAVESFDSFKSYATDTTTQKAMIQFELEASEVEENSYAILPSELEYKATTLKPLIPLNVKGTALSSSSFEAVVTDGFGSAVSPGYVTALIVSNFVLLDSLGNDITLSAPTESSPGVYTFTGVAFPGSGRYTIMVKSVTGYSDAFDSFDSI